jgi:hypothetical protein
LPARRARRRAASMVMFLTARRSREPERGLL